MTLQKLRYIGWKQNCPDAGNKIAVGTNISSISAEWAYFQHIDPECAATFALLIH